MSRCPYFCLLLTFLFSCQTDKPASTDEVITIQVREADIQEDVKLSDLVSDVEFIKLEDCKNCPVGEIDEILFYNNKYYLVSKFYNTGNVLVFNERGKFLYSLGVKGKGPEEYDNLTHLSVESHSNELIMTGARKLTYYSAEDGSFLRNEEIPFSADEVNKDREYYYLGDASDSSSLIILDKNKKVEEVKFTDRYRNISTPLSIFHSFGDTLLAYRPLYDTIYQIKGNSALPFRVLDFGENGIKDKLKTINREDRNQYRKILSQNISGPKLYLEVDDNILFYFNHYGDGMIALCQKSDMKTLIFPPTIKNDVTFENYFPWLSATDNQHYFIGLLTDFLNITKNLEGESASNKYGQTLKSILATSTEMSNPILVKITFKDFD